MTIQRYLPGFILSLLLALPAGAQTLAPIPALLSHVTDTAGLLDTRQRIALDNVLVDYENRTGSQIAVLLVSSTAPEVIDQYSIRVADAWKLGRKGIDDGVLLIVARDNPKDLRRLRIEVGRGVQGTVTDAQSKRILQDTIAPHFRQNDYYGGLVAGVSALTALLDQEHLPASAQKTKAGNNANSLDTWGPFLFIGFLVLMGVFRSRGSRGNAFNRSSWGGGGAGIILGSALSQIGRGGFGSGNSGGGGFGGGSSGGGFSGGGGGFDGGGASGDW